MGKYSKLKLCTNLSKTTLEKLGFKKGVYRKHIYKNIIQFELGINLDEREWYFQVLDNNTGGMYIPYYNRIFGKNEVVESLDKEVDKIFSKMKRNKVFYTKKKGEN